MHSVYGLVASDEPGCVRYIGKSCHPKNRLRAHIRDAAPGKKNTKKVAWIRGVHARGASIELVVLEEGLEATEVDQREIHWIAELRPSCNGTKGGDGGSTTHNGNYHLTPQGRANIAAATVPGNERAQKIAESKRRQWQDPEYRAKMLEHMRLMTEKSRETFAARRGVAQ